MVYIVNGGRKQAASSFADQLRGLSLDELHNRRKRLAEEMKDGIFSKDQMNMLDCKDEDEEIKRLASYEKWKNTPTNGKTNEQRMREWSDINREFKRRNVEGRVHCIDDIRAKKSVRYD